MKNGIAGTGGAIEANGWDESFVTIYDSKFIGNSCKNGGGAIYAYRTHLEIYTSEFTNNVQGVDFRGGGGGAIFIDGAYGTFHSKIYNSVFDSNAGGSNFGGAVHLKEASIEIHTSEFTSNSAVKGGAIFVDGSTSGDEYVDGVAGAQADIQQSNFHQNWVTHSKTCSKTTCTTECFGYLPCTGKYIYMYLCAL
jgi:predicted outer membrane repeat protein